MKKSLPDSATVCVDRNVALVMRDGAVLAADVYRPADDGQAPAVVCAYPYVKDAFIGPNHELIFRNLAQEGFAAVIVDMRGSGASQGTKPDAFDAQECTDMHDIVEQVAAQPWCNGRIGVWGISYGGIEAFRAATSRPPHLGAVVVIDGSSDPYRCEVMRYGVPGLAMITAEWATWMLAVQAMPPVAGVPTGAPSDLWRSRLDSIQPWFMPWREHSRRDDYWERKTVDPASITVPTLVFTGWRDTNPWVWDDFAQLTVPRRIVAGPWLHGLPDWDATAAINAVGEMVAWWRRWLSSDATDNQDNASPTVADLYVEGDARWERHFRWPAGSEESRFYLSADRTVDPTPTGRHARVTVPMHGLAGLHGGLGMTVAPLDQSEDDELSVCFDGPPVQQTFEIIGQPRVTLTARLVGGATDLAARLTDITPNGESRLISKGLIRIRPAESNPSLPAPETWENIPVVIELNAIRYSLKRGHRLRLSLARADFPEVWPCSQPASACELIIGDPSENTLDLPLLIDAPSCRPQFAPPMQQIRPLAPRDNWYKVTRDRGTATVEGGFDSTYNNPIGATIQASHSYRITGNDSAPVAPGLSSRTSITVSHRDTVILIEAETQHTEREASARLRVSRNGDEVFDRSFHGGALEGDLHTEGRQA